MKIEGRWTAILPVTAQMPALMVGHLSGSGLDAQLEEAADLLKAALEEESHNPLLTLALADLYVRMRRFELAANAYTHTLSLVPTHAVAYARLGALMWHMGRTEDSLGFFECALNFDPENAEALVNRLLIGARLAEWSEPEAQRDMIARLHQSRDPIAPGVCLALVDDPDFHARRAEIYSSSLPKAHDVLPARPLSNRRIRVGYFGHLSQQSATWKHLMDAHDPDRVEVIGYDFSLDRLEALGTSPNERCTLRPVKGQSDENIAQQARDDRLDAALDLEGQSLEGRPGVFSRRVAPVQIGGFSPTGTSGRDVLDYILADEVLIPSERRRLEAEKCLTLESGNLWLGALGGDSPVMSGGRRSLGLPEDMMVLASPASIRFLSPDMFSLWMRCLKRLPDAVLWLQSCAPEAKERLFAIAEEHGLDRERLVFGWLGVLPKQAGQIVHADLVLDCVTQNDHAGVTSALRYGVPVITCLGRCQTARSSGSALISMGLRELVADTIEEYERRIMDLATSPTKRNHIRSKLTGCTKAATAFDASRFARELEAGIVACVDRAGRGYLPDHINLRSHGFLPSAETVRRAGM